VLALLWLSVSTRRIPGVIRAGVLALAEEFGISSTKLTRELGELEGGGLIANDAKARLLRVRGAIEVDPPASSKVLTAWAIDFAELPESPVRDEIWRAIHDCLTDGEHRQKWADLTRRSDTVSNTQRDSASHTPVPYPFPVPYPDPQPQPQPSAEELQPYLETLERLGSPFEYAAAAARLSDSQKTELLRIDLPGDLAPALRGLATSFFAGDRARARPTLPDLIAKSNLRRELCEGKHEEVGRKWCCSRCGLDHPIIAACPPECDDCHRRHATDYVCDCLRLRQQREAAEAEELAANERHAAAQGVSVEEFRARLAESERQDRRAKFESLSARITSSPREAA